MHWSGEALASWTMVLCIAHSGFPSHCSTYSPWKIFICICMFLCTTVIQLIVYVCDMTWSHTTVWVLYFHVQIAPASKLSSYVFSMQQLTFAFSKLSEKELCMTDRPSCVFIDSSKRPDLACAILSQPYVLTAKARQIAASHLWQYPHPSTHMTSWLA